MTLVYALKEWRAQEAQRRGLETYRILPNRTLEAIAFEKPQTPEALLAIHGIGEKKVAMYGETILQIVSTYNLQPTTHDRERKTENDTRHTTQNGRQDTEYKVRNTYDSDELNVNGQWSNVCSVGEFLDRTNAVLAEMPAAVRGEISSADVRERYVFFTIKDEGGASMSCFMWRRDYDICGVVAQEGAEIIVRGFLEVYKPSGRLTFRARSVELVGEGALKAAYEKLKTKLESEGLFAPEKKRALPNFPERIGLITSKEGAVIHDFMSNLGRYGFRILSVPSRVEGALAVPELISAIRTLRKKPIDVLVVIRGGGSLESLAAFNNETLVREIANFPVPVLCGIGHDQDVPLASLVADLAVSTPTATTRELGKTWEHTLAHVEMCERKIAHRFESALAQQMRAVEETHGMFLGFFANITDRCRRAQEAMRRCVSVLKQGIENTHNQISRAKRGIYGGIDRGIYSTYERVTSLEKILSGNDPRRQLRLGYSIVRSGTKVVRSVKNVQVGEKLDILLSDGEVKAKVEGTSLK